LYKKKMIGPDEKYKTLVDYATQRIPEITDKLKKASEDAVQGLFMLKQHSAKFKEHLDDGGEVPERFKRLEHRLAKERQAHEELVEKTEAFEGQTLKSIEERVSEATALATRLDLAEELLEQTDGKIDKGARDIFDEKITPVVTRVNHELSEEKEYQEEKTRKMNEALESKIQAVVDSTQISLNKISEKIQKTDRKLNDTLQDRVDELLDDLEEVKE
jgi:hypothetical protein